MSLSVPIRNTFAVQSFWPFFFKLLHFKLTTDTMDKYSIKKLFWMAKLSCLWIPQRQTSAHYSSKILIFSPHSHFMNISHNIVFMRREKGSTALVWIQVHNLVGVQLPQLKHIWISNYYICVYLLYSLYVYAQYGVRNWTVAQCVFNSGSLSSLSLRGALRLTEECLRHPQHTWSPLSIHFTGLHPLTGQPGNGPGSFIFPSL